MMPAQSLDARGLLCPMPVIKLQERSADLKNDSEILVLATDPGVLEDIPAWCRINGHEHLSSMNIDKEFHVKVMLRV